MQDWHLWVIAGIALLIVEMFTFSFLFGSFGTAALITAAVAGQDASLAWQLFTFCVASAVCLAIMRPLARKAHVSAEHKPTNVHALVGRQGIVIESVGQQPGRVKLGGEEWRAIAESSQSLDEGTAVCITNVQGATLTVRAAD